MLNHVEKQQMLL